MACDSRLEPCPVCGLPLDAPPWVGETPSFAICPCCGTQFGYDDHCAADAVARRAWWREARRVWIAEGMSWWDAEGPPPGWNPVSQVAGLAEGTL